MSEGLQVGPASSSTYCHHQYYHYDDLNQQASSYNRQFSSPETNLTYPHWSSRQQDQHARHNHNNHHHHQHQQNSAPWSAAKRGAQVHLIKNASSSSDNKLNKSSNLINPAHSRSSSPAASDASPMMRAPALYRPDTGDSGGVAGGPLMPLSHPAAPSCQQAGGGGQRTALKLASTASQQQQQQQQQQHHHHNNNNNNNRKMPICQRSTWPAGPSPSSQSPGQADFADYDGQQSDECSCSSSIDCLSSSPTGHLIEPASVHQQHHLHQPHHHSHHHRRQQQQQHQQQHHLIERLSDDDCSFIQHHHHHQAFHDHRPLMQHSSVPPYTGSSASQQHQQTPHQQALSQVQPPPLVRQTTYTATPETITDSAPAGAGGSGLPIPLTPPPPPGSSAATTSNNNADLVINAGPAGYHTMSRLDQKQAACQYSKQRQTVSFRRSATADYAVEMKHQQRQPDNIYSDNNDDKSAHKALLHRQRSAGIGLTSSSRTACSAGAPLKQSSLSRTTNNNAHNNNNNNNSNAKSNGQPGGQLRPASLHNHTTSPLSIVANSSNNHQHQLNAAASITPGGAGFPPNSPLPNQAIRAGLLAPLATTFDGVCSLPAITSHRTNSPWMRISSIILAPIGLIIILFIVVSPLLHYLM